MVLAKVPQNTLASWRTKFKG